MGLFALLPRLSLLISGVVGRARVKVAQRARSPSPFPIIRARFWLAARPPLSASVGSIPKMQGLRIPIPQKELIHLWRSVDVWVRMWVKKLGFFVALLSVFTVSLPRDFHALICI